MIMQCNGRGKDKRNFKPGKNRIERRNVQKTPGGKSSCR